MYPETLVKPMKSELTGAGFEDLTTPTAVDNAIKEKGTTLLVFNSVCGCSAGAARPGILLSLRGDKNLTILLLYLQASMWKLQRRQEGTLCRILLRHLQ